MKLDWPQITYLILAFINLLLYANAHGKPKTGNENFWTSLIALALSLTLMYHGGFFTK